MKKNIVTSLIVCTTLGATLSARGLMPSIDRIKKKVDAALESGTQQAFKELLAGAHNGIITLDKNQEASTPKNLAAAEKQLADLYWAHQDALITQLDTTSKQSHTDAAHLLKAKIKEKYTHTNVPLVTF